MIVRFYVDAETGQPHIYNHGVAEAEVRQVLAGRGVDERGREASRVKYGQTVAGRYLKVIYKKREEGSELFIISAYELTGRMRKALRRRLRRRGK